MLRRPAKTVSSANRNVKRTFWHFDHSRSEHEASFFRTGPSKICRWNLLRNSGYLKTVLYSELQPTLIENVIKRLWKIGDVKWFKCEILCNSTPRRTDIYNTVTHMYTTQDCYFVRLIFYH